MRVLFDSAIPAVLRDPVLHKILAEPGATGACCIQDHWDMTCMNLTPSACAVLSGTFQGIGTHCFNGTDGFHCCPKVKLRVSWGNQFTFFPCPHTPPTYCELDFNSCACCYIAQLEWNTISNRCDAQFLIGATCDSNMACFCFNPDSECHDGRCQSEMDFFLNGDGTWELAASLSAIGCGDCGSYLESIDVTGIDDVGDFVHRTDCEGHSTDVFYSVGTTVLVCE